MICYDAVRSMLKLYSDGGARGNPGPAAVAFLAVNDDGVVFMSSSRFLGVRTNNQAEYEALISGLEYAQSFAAEEVLCHLDSELVVKQLNGKYAVKDAALKLLFSKVNALKPNFSSVKFVYVPRLNAYIQRVDALVNEALDKSEGTVRCQLNFEPEVAVLVHTSIRVSNMEKSIAFYKKFLGLNLVSRREIKQNNAQIAFLHDAAGKGAMLELTYYRSQKRFVQPKYEERLFDHLGFEVKNVQSLVAFMKREGVVISDEPFRLGADGPTIAFAEDPDGTLIELIER
jgi:lactoylglutathione lyase